MRGYLILFLSVFFNALGFYAYKMALEGTTPLMVALVNAFFTLSIFLMTGIIWRLLKIDSGEFQTISPAAMFRCFRKHPFWLVMPPLGMALNGWLMGVSFKNYGAELTAFLMNMSLVFLVFAGLLMKERIVLREWGAILLMITGAFMYSYQGGTLQFGALGLMVIICSMIAIKQLTVKQVSRHEPLPLVMATVILLCCAWTSGLVCYCGSWQVVPLRSIGFCFLSAFLCSVVGMSFLYAAYHIVGVAKGAPFNALRPVAVLLIGLCFGAELPAWIQLCGGGLILAGSLILTFQSVMRKKLMENTLIAAELDVPPVRIS